MIGPGIELRVLDTLVLLYFHSLRSRRHRSGVLLGFYGVFRRYCLLLLFLATEDCPTHAFLAPSIRRALG